MADNFSSLIQVNENTSYIVSSVEVNEEASYVSVLEPGQNLTDVIEVQNSNIVQIFEGQSYFSPEVKKYVETIGDGSATSFTITHNLNTQDCFVSVRSNANPYPEVYPDIQKSTVNTLTVSFTTAPAAGLYRVSVIG